MTFERLAVVVQQSIDEPEELHHTLVLADIFVALENERIGDAVVAA